MFTCRVTLAQQVAMRIFNGSFEEFKANNGFQQNGLHLYWPPFADTLYNWFGKGFFIMLQDGYCMDNGINGSSPDTSIKPIDGTYYLVLNAKTNSELQYPFPEFPNYCVGGVGQKTTCIFHKGIKYKISLNATFDSLRYFEFINNDVCESIVNVCNKPKLSIWLGDRNIGMNFNNWLQNTQNNYQGILSEYEVPFRSWEKINISFTPNSDYEYIYFHPIISAINSSISTTESIYHYNLILDAVSDIYYGEPTFVLPPNDTLVIGDCYEVDPYNIHPNPAEHRWEIMGSDSVFFIGDNPQLCPTQTTSYIVRSHDDCGWAVADTLTLFVKPQPDKPPMPTSDLVIFPNPGTSDGMMHVKSSDTGRIHLFDAAGKVVGAFTLVEGEQTIPVNLARGIYFYQAAFSNQSRKHGKYLVANN
jgi:hypothetical protein